MDLVEIKRSKTEAPPAHYILKIESFSQLSDSEIVEKTADGKYESDEFEAGDYKWKLVLYPNGNKKTNGKGHISLYLASTNIKEISRTNGGGNINVLISFFVYDQIQDNYLKIQDGKIKRYHILRTENGFDQLLPLADFNNPRNGYVIDDCCVFGVEVNVIKNTVIGNGLSFIKNPPNGIFTWKIDKFSTLKNEYYFSEVFTGGGFEWKLSLYPNGNAEGKDRNLSLFLVLDDDKIGQNNKVYAEYNLLVKDQINEKHVDIKVSRWFDQSSTLGWGFRTFMLLSDLRNASKGFIVNDTLVVEAKITLISVSQHLIA